MNLLLKKIFPRPHAYAAAPSTLSASPADGVSTLTERKRAEPYDRELERLRAHDDAMAPADPYRVWRDLIRR